MRKQTGCRPVRVLLMGNDPGDAHQVREFLTGDGSAGFDLDWVDELSTGLERLEGGGIDAILLDVGESEDDSIAEIASRVQAQIQEVPVLVIASLNDHASAMKALQQGAQDYLVKGQFDGNSIERAIRYAIERMRALDGYRAILRTAMDGFWVVDHKGCLLEVNESYCHATGYTRAELLTMTVADLEAEETRSVAWQHMLQMVERGSDRFETRHLCRDGSFIDLEVSAIYTEACGGRFFALLEDITERKRAEEELKHARLMLMHSERMASIGQLAAGVAHEINNPIAFVNSNLNTLTGYLRDLRAYIDGCEEARRTIESRLGYQVAGEYETMDRLRQSLDLEYLLSDVDKLVSESLDGSQRVKKIVQDLRTFSRASDNADVQMSNVESILDSALNIVWNQLKYTCTVTKDYSGVGAVECNPNQLGQVFINMLVNAGQAIDKNTPGHISIKTFTEAKSILIEISDNGTGIPREHLEKIFGPFFTTKPPGQGTGLGLAISYKIIKNHGGEIFVHSEVSIGTTFTIKLPIPTTK